MAIPRADIAGTRPTATIEPPKPLDALANARQDTFNRLAQIMLGRQLQAEVLSRFNDGTFLVRVADTPARMSLPEGTKIGDNLRMTMLAHQPRPTFLLEADPGSAKATLSSAGRLIDTILQVAQRKGAEPAVHSRAPVLPVPAMLATASSTPQIADALQTSLTFSGVFYESHLQEWANGARSQADLMREPQAQIQNSVVPARPSPVAPEAQSPTPQPPPLPDKGSQPSPQSSLPSQSSLPPDLEARLAELLRNAQPLTTNTAVTDADTMLPLASDSEAALVESMQMIPAQLHALEQKEVIWRGELFPGLPMEWSVNEDASRKDGETGEPKQWQSAVRFELPALGAVSAVILLDGDRVQIQMRTASEATAATLRARAQELADALTSAGSPLDSLQIKQDEQA